MNENMLGAYGAWAAALRGDELPLLSFRRQEFRSVAAWRRRAVARMTELLAPPPAEDPPRVQVVKQYKRYRVVKVTRKVVFGDPEKVDRILGSSTVSNKINTSYVERYNNTIRHTDSRCTRKSLRFSKCKENHERQLVLSLSHYHLCRPHGSLKKVHGKSTTPFMAANLTDHVWSMGELLRFDPEKQRP